MVLRKEKNRKSDQEKNQIRKEDSLGNKIFLLMLFAGSLLLGTISIFFLPVELMPPSTYPGLTLQTEYPGVTPDKIEEIITRPLEDIISTVGGIKKLFSISEEGKSRIHIQFDHDDDLRLKAADIRAKVDLVSSSFPREVQEPVLLQYDPDQKPVMIVVLQSKSIDLMEQREIADRILKKRLEGVSGVSEISVSGGRIREILVDIDMQKIDAYQLSFNQVLNQLQLNNINTTSGYIYRDGGRFSLYTKGRFTGLKEISDLMIYQDSSKIVRLYNIADISYAYREKDSSSRYNGKESVALYIHSAASANILDLSAELKNRLNNLAGSEYKDLEYEYIYDEADLISKSKDEFLLNFFLSIFSAGIGFYWFSRDLRLSLFLTILPPSVFLATAFHQYLLRVEYNLISISGILFSYSLLLAAVFFKYFSTGLDQLHLRNKTGAAILILLAVFLPLVFAGEKSSALYSQIALTLLLSLSVFYFFLFFIWTKIFSFNMDRDVSKKNYLISRLKDWNLAQKLHVFAYSDIFKIRMRKIFFQYKKLNIKLLLWILRRPSQAYLFAIFYLGISLFVFAFSKKEFSSPLEERVIRANVEMDSGTSFESTDGEVKKIEKVLSGENLIKEINSKVDPAHASIHVKLKDNFHYSDAYMSKLEKKIEDKSSAFVYFSKSSDDQTLNEISIDVLGEEIEKIDGIVRRLAKDSQRIEGVSKVLLRYKGSRPELQIILDRFKMEKAGISSREIGQFTRYAIQGGVATKFIESNREVDVRIRYQRRFHSLEQIRQFKILNQYGQLIPLAEIADFSMQKAPVKIYRKNKKRVLSFSLRLGNANLDRVLERISEYQKLPLPENYRIEPGSELSESLKQRKSLVFSLALSLALIYMILASYYENLRRPFYLLLPLLFIAGTIMIALGIFRLPVSISFYLSMVLLAGLSLFYSLIIYDYMEYGFVKKNNFRSEKAGWLFIVRFFAENMLQLPGLLLKSSLLISIFYLPFFLFGESNPFLREITETLFIGNIVIALFLPFWIFMTFLFVYEGLDSGKISGISRSAYDYALQFLSRNLRSKP